MKGTIKEISNNYIIYDDIQTTSGNSGSPVYQKGMNDINIIGIHVGMETTYNYATLITEDIY